MEQPVVQVRYAIQEMLGDRPSPIFMGRIEKTLDEGAKDRDSLCLACDKVQKMVNLFISVDIAKVMGQRFKEILEGSV
jgi:hypothetical protein